MLVGLVGVIALQLAQLFGGPHFLGNAGTLLFGIVLLPNFAIQLRTGTLSQAQKRLMSFGLVAGVLVVVFSIAALVS